MISLSCSSAEESDSGHKDDDHGMLIDLSLSPRITSFSSVVRRITFHCNDFLSL